LAGVALQVADRRRFRSPPPESPHIEARVRSSSAPGAAHGNGGGARRCDVAVGLDPYGRHYFVSLDGRQYRTVPHFPRGPEQARAMFGEASDEGQSKLQLLAAYGSEIAFVPMISRNAG
jgi:hypothetical protein